jgi:hypothetical protein
MLFNSFLFLLFNAIHARVVVQAPNKSMERILSELNKKLSGGLWLGHLCGPSPLEKKKVKKKTALHTSSCLHHSFDANVHYGRRKE